MSSCSDRDPQVEPLWAMDLKGFDKAELESLVGYIDQTITWINDKGIGEAGTEDVIGFRVGLPTTTADDTTEIVELYTANGDLDQLITAISLDVLKVTVKTTQSGVTYARPYTFKSTFPHTRFDKYFTDDVNNYSGFAYLDDKRMGLSDLTSIPVQYDGSVARTLEPLAIPDYVYACVVYLIQNTTLFQVTDANAPLTYGDITYYSTYGFLQHITNIRTKAADIIARLATPYQEDIHELLTYLGVDQAFKDIKFGGDFDEMRVVIRIPASRKNQLTLEGLLGDGDVFLDIFKPQAVAHSLKELEEHEKREDLADPYNGDKLDYPELDDLDGVYGCYADLNNFRYWYVSDAWLQTLTPEQLSIVFWMGLDIVTGQGDKCPFDEILAVIIIIIITYFSAGLGTGTALTVAQGLTIASGLLSIASVTGVIDAETAGMIAIALSVVTFGSSLMTTGVSVTSGFSSLLSIASQVLDTVQRMEATAFEDAMEDKQEEMKTLEADANMWESEFRFSYGDSFEMGVREGPEADPYAYLKDTYDAYTIFKSNGFQ